MVFCPLIAAMAMQVVALGTNDVVIENVRPSRIAKQMNLGLVPKECRVEALDAEGILRLWGRESDRKAMEKYVHMFDVKPVTVALSILIESKIDKVAHRFDVEVANNEEFSFTESTTGLRVGVTPRVNGDGTVTTYISYGLKTMTYKSVFRLRAKQFYVFCSGEHGSCNSIAETAEHPPMIDPVLVVSYKLPDEK